MKSIKNLKLIILAIISIIFCLDSAKGQWVQTNGPFGGTIKKIAVSGTKTFAVDLAR